MSYYDNSEKLALRGIDYDLYACLQHNPQHNFDVNMIKKVLAVFEGENDVSSWHWVLELNNNKFAYLTGGCDYTGWDCQSSASHTMIDTPLAVIDLIDDWKGEDRNKQIAESFIKQLNEGKDQTWREQKDAEFGLIEKKEIAKKVLTVEDKKQVLEIILLQYERDHIYNPYVPENNNKWVEDAFANIYKLVTGEDFCVACNNTGRWWYETSKAVHNPANPDGEPLEVPDGFYVPCLVCSDTDDEYTQR